MELTAMIRRHPARVGVAALAALILVGGAIGVVAANRGGGAPPPLVLAPGGGRPAEGAIAAYKPGVPLDGNSYHYRLATTPPDFGASAPVARLEVPTLDQSRVRAFAAALGLRGAVEHSNGDWTVASGSARLTVEPTAGGWSVAYDFDAPASTPGSVTGSSGAGSAGSAGSSGSAISPPAPIPPVAPTPAPTLTAPVPTPSPGSTTFESPGKNLPGAAGAEQMARALLAKFGLDADSWSATVTDSSRTTVSCAPVRCPTPYALLTTRTVVLDPTFDSIPVDGIAWQVDIGDNGKIDDVTGTWTTLRTLGRYPLRSVKSVFADLVSGASTSPDPTPVGARPPAPGNASPDYVVAPLTAEIDHIALGYAATSAVADGVAVVDVVPTYIFSGHAGAEVAVTRSLVAVKTSPLSANVDPGSTTTLPNVSSSPLGQPEPQPAPGSPPTVSGTAPR